MQEIESSSRLYREGDALFLTANFLYGVEGGEYGSTADHLRARQQRSRDGALRHPPAFEVFAARVQRAPGRCSAARTR